MRIPQFNPRYVVDIGMNNGNDSKYYLEKGFIVISIEANPELCEAAREKFSLSIREGRLTILNAAIAENNLEQTFYINLNNDHWSSLDLKWASRENTNVKKIHIPGMRLDRYLNESQISPHFIKIDIEGGDMMALKQILRTEFRPQYLSIEDCHLGFQYIKVLTQHGYNKFKLINQAQVPFHKDNDLNFSFELGSSGLFGEDTLGDWMTSNDFVDYYFKVARNPTTLVRIARPDIWWDIHCSL